MYKLYTFFVGEEEDAFASRVKRACVTESFFEKMCQNEVGWGENDAGSVVPQ